MNKYLLLLAGCTVFLSSTSVKALIYVDSAPNAYGSPDYTPWKNDAYAKAASGQFINMKNSVNPANQGTTNFEIEDVTVYSFGDLGKRLHFIYWMPGETIQTLKDKDFGVSLSYVWDGVSYDFYNDYYGKTWITPSSWVELNGGVIATTGDLNNDGTIGTAGFAWWGAYGVNTPEALAADLAEWDKYQGDITFKTRMSDGAGGYTEESLTAHHVPAVPDGGGTLMLLSCGLFGLAAFRYKA